MDSDTLNVPSPSVAKSAKPRPRQKRPSSTDTIVAAVKQGILTGRYLPGQRLLESDLREEYQVSRGPVREALTRLAGEGVVTAGPDRGTYIRALTRTDALNLLQVLKLLIDLAVRLAAVRCRYAENRQKLQAAYERLERSIAEGDSVMLSIERTRFYDTLFEVAGNPELARAHPTVAAQILRAQVHPHLSQEDRQSQYHDYAPLYEAIMEGDTRAAQRIVATHLRRSRMHAQHLPDAAFQTPGS